MDIAKSMYLGGKEIHAENPRLKPHSCKELGLRCAYCGEPVFHKNGYYNKAHFSHFPSIDPQKYEECLIRQRSANGISFSDHPWWQDGGESQRFDLFQKHFFYILKTEFPGMEIREISINPQDVELSDIQTKALKLAVQNKPGTDKYLRICDDRFAEIEIDIIIEVLDYITKPSSRNIFNAISEYSIQRLLEVDRVFQNDDLDPKDLHCDIVNLIVSIPWLKVLARITDVEFEKIHESIKVAKGKSFLREVSYSSSGNKSYIYCHKSKIFIADIKKFNLFNEVELAKIDVRRMLSSSWMIQAKRVPISVSQDQELFKVVRRNKDIFDETVKRRLTIKLREAINTYIEEEDSLEVLFRHRDLGVICLDELTEEFLELGESKVFLIRGSSEKDIALININKSSIKYQNYVFNSGCIKFTHEYRRLLLCGNFEIEKAVVKLLQEIYSILKR